MSTWQLQDSFQPYYAGRKDPAFIRKPLRLVNAKAVDRNGCQMPPEEAETTPQQAEDET